MSQELFSIYASGRCSEISAQGVWVATTHADCAKPYSVDFFGIGYCTGPKVLIVKALTKAFADLERDGSRIILYVDDTKLSGTIADIIASKRHPDTAGSGQVWERFLFQLRRHDVMVGKFDRSEANAKSLLARLDELLSEDWN